MTEAIILDYTVRAMLLVLLLSLPPIIVATLLGVGVSLLQALTQVQEQTLGFVVKLVAVTITMLISAHFIGAELLRFTLDIFEHFPTLVK